MSSWTQADVDIAIGKIEAAKRKISPHSERSPKTGATVCAKAERPSVAAKRRKGNPEWEIQAEYIRRMEQKHPLVMCFSDTAAHISKTELQQIRANKLQSEISKKWPDVLVAQPSGDYAGLFLEFKAETPYKMDGVTLKKTKDDHTEKQAATMERLWQRGYYCAFVWTVEDAIRITEKYLNQ